MCHDVCHCNPLSTEMGCPVCGLPTPTACRMVAEKMQQKRNAAHAETETTSDSRKEVVSNRQSSTQSRATEGQGVHATTPGVTTVAPGASACRPPAPPAKASESDPIEAHAWLVWCGPGDRDGYDARIFFDRTSAEVHDDELQGRDDDADLRTQGVHDLILRSEADERLASAHAPLADDQCLWRGEVRKVRHVDKNALDKPVKEEYYMTIPPHADVVILEAALAAREGKP